MTVTNEHIAGLRALLMEKETELEHWFSLFDERGDGAAFGRTVAAAFTEATLHLLGGRPSRSEVIRLVANLRIRHPGITESINPSVAERLVVGMLGDEYVMSRLSEEDKQLQIPLLVAMVGSAEFDEGSLKDFLSKVRARALE